MHIPLLYFIYALPVWGGTFPTHLEPLLTLQKRLVRIVTGEHFHAHTPPLFLKTKILRLNDIHIFVLAQIGFKSNIQCNNFPIHNHDTRYGDLLRTDFTRLTICQNSFNYLLPKIWNNLPIHIKNITKFNKFKFDLKSYLISAYAFL